MMEILNRRISTFTHFSLSLLSHKNHVDAMQISIILANVAAEVDFNISLLHYVSRDNILANWFTYDKKLRYITFPI